MSAGDVHTSAQDSTSSASEDSASDLTMFERMVQAMPDEALVRCDRFGVITDVSRAAIELGISDSDARHRHIDVFIHPDDRALLGRNYHERSRNGGISHWTPIRVNIDHGWRRLEFISTTAESGSAIGHFRLMRLEANPADQLALDEFVLQLAPAEPNDPAEQLTGALSTLCRLTGWHQAALQLTGSTDTVIAAASIDLDKPASQPWDNVDSRFAEIARPSAERQAASRAKSEPFQSVFTVPIGGPDSGVELELCHADLGVVFTARQRQLIDYAAEALGQSSTRWHLEPAPVPELPKIDPVTRLATRLTLVDDLRRRLDASDPSTVGVFRIALIGLHNLQHGRDDTAAAHIVVAVSHAIRFVLDDALIARTGEDELTVVTSELEDGETVDEVSSALKLEMEESFSWRFGVEPVVVAQSGGRGRPVADLLSQTQHALAAARLSR